MDNIKLNKWKILIKKDSTEDKDVAERLNQIIHYLSDHYDIKTFDTDNKEDFYNILNYKNDLAAVLIEYDIDNKKDFDSNLLYIQKVNPRIPVIAFSKDRDIQKFDIRNYDQLTDFYFILTDTVDFLAERLMNHAKRYVDNVIPVFLRSLIEYLQEEKYPWHTPGHMGGDAFRKDPTGQFFYNFLGENVFRADLSISVDKLGSLLDHSGPIGQAEKNASKVFGSDLTYFVLNGTSSVNQIIWRGRVTHGDLAFVDRNCHKSLNYAVVGAEAIPSYMVPRRNGLGIIGPVRLTEFSRKSIKQKLKRNPLVDNDRYDEKIQMSALTNSTYDGLCYNVNKIKFELDKSVKNMHFDEAWFPYAKFSSLYKDHFAMANDSENDMKYPPIFASQSTHKLLAAFSQSSMLHAKNGTQGTISENIVDPEMFNEAYMMYGSTSPQYNMIASLDVASKMMELDGEKLINGSIVDAINLRKNMMKVYHEAKNNSDWYFKPWQPEYFMIDGHKQAFEDIDTNYLCQHQECWELNKEDNWHGFEDMEDHYVMLDPTKLTIRTPGITPTGQYEKQGIPANIVTNFLEERGIVCEKTDYYSFLMLNSLGTTKSKQAALLVELMHFKNLYDKNEPMINVFPKLCKKYPGKYEDEGLKDHCQRMHERICELDLLKKMDRAFEIIPDPEMTPYEASKYVFKQKVKKVKVSEMMGNTAAVMVVPYPPGIPILMGGEKVNADSQPIIDYLLEREKFEQEFPGYYGDIHGIIPKIINGKRVFTTMIIDK